ncbi:hypothetical protein [Elizabethkingia anophelis]|uniref:Uncharacterized protein n=1 Tax=Elizabethkingia anophelis TaxID=1117645 RepID=A0AAU8UQE6_9FLAO|nr:hypothetical protein [Elizabethkingia anophelis]AQX00458.1 hypothetical protein BBD32_02745 [Elizabethkingia anophelis]OPB66226.1 hypothetical protein BAY11_14775 [Elizabethkingia anophelis]
MSEFKGTKGKLTVREAVGAMGEVLYFSVQHKGNSIADFSENPYTEIPTSLDNARANAFLFSKAPEMLSILEKIVEYQDDYFGDYPKTHQAFKKIAYEAEQLIKEATEL